MTTTRTRSRGHTGSRASAARAGAERKPVIIASALGGAILLAFAALVTSIGHIVLAATDHFMLKYSGVFALVLLTTSAVMGVLATDRIILNPGHRVIAQAVHRAVAFGTLAFLVVHIVLEIAAPHLEESKTLHVHLLDAFIPFSRSTALSIWPRDNSLGPYYPARRYRILRRRFSANGNAWKWRAIHYSNYAALILGVLHGLLAGRKAIGTFVYWSYGVVLAMLAIAVLVRIIATSPADEGDGRGRGPVGRQPRLGFGAVHAGPGRGARPHEPDERRGAAGRGDQGPACRAERTGDAVPVPTRLRRAGAADRRAAGAGPSGSRGTGGRWPDAAV